MDGYQPYSENDLPVGQGIVIRFVPTVPPCQQIIISHLVIVAIIRYEKILNHLSVLIFPFGFLLLLIEFLLLLLYLVYTWTILM